MNETEALRRLDEIEQLDPDASLDVGAFKIMEVVGKDPKGLRLLIERYSSSPSANLTCYLALLLSLKSGHAIPEIAPLAFEFAGNLKRKDCDGPLISTLNAMKNQLVFGPGWGNTPRPPGPLFPFLEHCLNYDGKHSILVQFAAVELVTVICERKLVAAAFKPNEWNWIESRANELSNTDDDLLGGALEEFRDCVKKEGSDANRNG